MGINRAMLPLKVILFGWYGACSCLLPYMTIHMKQLGITVEETAFVFTVLPVTLIIGPTIAGFIADKIGKYKPVLLIALSVSIITCVAIMFVPGSINPDTVLHDVHGANNNTDHTMSVHTADHSLTFWLYFALRMVFQTCIGIGFPLLDATVLVMCDRHNSDYGRERFWAVLSTGVFSPICGYIIDTLNSGGDELSTDYRPAFYFFIVLIAFTIAALVAMNIEVQPPPKNIWKNFKPLLRSWKIWVLLVVILMLGTFGGFLETFLFWYLIDLQAPNYLLGLTLTTGALVGLPFLHTSDWFVRKFGHVELMIWALVMYLIRYVGYSLIVNPFWCIPYEALEAFTYHLMWVAAATYSAQMAPPGLMATMQGIVGGLHFGVGRSTGSMIGGTLMAVFSARIAFQVIGAVAGITAIIYTVIYAVFLRDDAIAFENDVKPVKSMAANGLKRESESDESEPMTEDTSELCERELKIQVLDASSDGRKSRRDSTCSALSITHLAYPIIQT